MNKALYKRINECIESKSLRLDLGDIDFESVDFQTPTIKNAFYECRHIEVLILSPEWTDMITDETLKSLYAANNPFLRYKRSKLSSLPSVIAELKNLTELICSANGIKDISALSKLNKLEYVDLSNNSIDDISPFKKLQTLKKLNLWDNEISQLDETALPTSLKYLDLSGNSISDISSLEKLTNLLSLNLNINHVSDLTPLQNLSNLKRLGVCRNQLKDIAPLANLSSLVHLELVGNLLTDISPLQNVTSIRILDIKQNLLNDVTALQNFHSLELLDISNNRITSIRPLLSTGRHIELFASENRIDSLSHEEFATFFNFNYENEEYYSVALDIVKTQKNNIVQKQRYEEAAQIRDVEREIKEERDLFRLGKLQTPGKWYSEDRLKIERWFLEQRILSNPITSPPIEILTKGSEAVLNYYADSAKEGVKYLYEAKMLIVGQPRSGKTSLRYKLHDLRSELPLEDATTRGIDIERLEFDIIDKEGNKRPFYYNVWDFGGQQIYQTTHQFFLSHRSLYVLVLDTGKDSIGNDDTTVNYWLQTIELLGDNSPVLFIKNEKNERQAIIDMLQKKSRFDFIKGDFNIDLNALIPGTPTYDKKREDDFIRLKKEMESELQNLPLIGFSMPKNWVEIRDELEKLSHQYSSISLTDYVTLCKKNGVNDFDRQMELSRIFHDLGVFLHFQDHSALEDFIILQNVWATDAVFAVLDNESVKMTNGKFTDNDLPAIWESKGYPKQVHKKLLALMMKFELCYKVDNTARPVYIIPEMLPEKVQGDYAWVPKQDLPLQYHYDFMPKGLLTRLIVRLNTFIAQDNGVQLVWKTGVKIDGALLDCPNTFAEIIEAWDSKQLLIRAQGFFSKELIGKLTFEIDMLNNDLFKQISGGTAKKTSRWSKMIPCICSACINNPNKHFHNYHDLLERRNFGKSTIECPRPPYEIVEISRLVDGIFPSDKPVITAPTIAGPIIVTSAPKLFISYSHLDEQQWKDEFVKHLSPLRDQGLISDWNDRKIEAGTWNPQIEEAMKNSDIFILLITHNFISSKYISSKEITTAYSRYKEHKSKIIPVVCDSCDWALLPITNSEKEFHPTLKKELFVWLGKFQPFPKDGKPIKNWPNMQDGFLDVINQLKNNLK
jgi:internalin A